MMNLINSTIDIFDQELINKNIKLNFEYESVSSHKVIGDYDKIKQILINLIANAIKFSKNNIIILNTYVSVSKPRIITK